MYNKSGYYTKNMKLKISQKTVKEVDIELPYHASDGNTFIRAEKEVNGFVHGIFCHHYPNNEKAEIQIGIIPEEWLLYPEITPERFNDKINEMLELIKMKL